MDIPETLKSILWIGALFFGLYWLFRAVPTPSVERTERIEKTIIERIPEVKTEKEKNELAKVLVSEIKTEEKALEKEIQAMDQSKLPPPPEVATNDASTPEEKTKNARLNEIKSECFRLFNYANDKINEAKQKDTDILALNEEKEKILDEYEASKDYRLLDKIKDIETQCEVKHREINVIVSEINNIRDQDNKLRIEFREIKNSLKKPS